MGFLKKGKALEWKSSQKHIELIKNEGINQFIRIYKSHEKTETSHFCWGDEIEYIVLKKTPDGFKVSHNGYKAIERLEKLSEKINPLKMVCKLLPEYGSFMIESTPNFPYDGSLCDLMLVERNMQTRRFLIEALLEQNEVLLSVSNFPRLGTENYCFPPAKAGGEASLSEWISDESINPHPRFRFLTRNIRERRGSKVRIAVPQFAAEQGQSPIIMDAMAFGMGCCCLQVTLQAKNMCHSRCLYDQLVVLSPIFLALTAATPFHKGRVADWDVRWNIISQSVDCRSPAERGQKPLGSSEQLISKSRFSPVSSYLSAPGMAQKLNDISPEIDQKCLETLLANEVDEQMARHIAHLFVRDPLVVFEDDLEVAETHGNAKKTAGVNTDQFESIQSTNWQTCRIKPPSGGNNGWRVEFRAMEVQITDFENAAFSVFLVLLSRAILHFRVSFYLPMSRVYSNMAKAHKRNACRAEKFHFAASFGACRCEIAKTAENKPNSNGNAKCAADDSRRPAASLRMEEKEICRGLYSVKQIVCGDKGFVGLLGLVKRYIAHAAESNASFGRTLGQYLALVEARASGRLLTTAQWMREFVAGNSGSDPGSIGPEACDLLMERIARISAGDEAAPELLGGFAPAGNAKSKKARRDIAEAVKSGDTEKLESLLAVGVQHRDDWGVCAEI